MLEAMRGQLPAARMNGLRQRLLSPSTSDFSFDAMPVIQHQPQAGTEFITLHEQAGQPRIEYRRVSGRPFRAAAERHCIVFLHEGLGSVAAWRDFPDQLCSACGLDGLVYSRPGYGRSTPRAAGEHWDARYLHRQAQDILPALLAALDICQPWLFGHSDGASIALLHAAAFPAQIAGCIALAPHVFVETKGLDGIRRARRAYESGALREPLQRLHDDTDSAFYGWCNAWLAPGFRHWAIEADIATLRCPLLLVQGEDDGYGTLEQIDSIVRVVPHARRLVLANCGHIPQRDAPATVIRATAHFMAEHR
jgi:pimeloyl-ACP methyl ester carboxylesterase